MVPVGFRHHSPRSCVYDSSNLRSQLALCRSHRHRIRYFSIGSFVAHTTVSFTAPSRRVTGLSQKKERCVHSRTRACSLLSLHPYFGTLMPCLKKMVQPENHHLFRHSRLTVPDDRLLQVFDGGPNTLCWFQYQLYPFGKRPVHPQRNVLDSDKGFLRVRLSPRAFPVNLLANAAV